MEQIYNLHLNNKAEKSKRIEYGNLLFCFVIALQAITNMFCGTIRLFISTRSLDTLLIYALLAIVFLKTIPEFYPRITIKEFAAIGFLIITWMYSYLKSDNSKVFTEVLVDILQTCILTWIASRVIHVTDKFVTYLRVAAYLIILRFPVDLFVLSEGIFDNVYSQYAGYQLYIGFTMLLVPMLLQRKWHDYVVAVLCTVFTLITGARGPFVFLVVSFIVCMLIISNEKKRLAKILLFLAIATIIIILNMQSIMKFFLNIVSLGGGSSRTIQTIINGNFFTYLSGRQNVYPIAIDYILEHPILGSGFVNDRVYLSQSMDSYISAIGNYAHNIFLEIGMQFGLIIGFIIILLLFIFINNTYKRQNTIENRLFYTALLCSALLPLLVSGSYLSSPMFYALIGYSFGNSLRNND